MSTKYWLYLVLHALLAVTGFFLSTKEDTFLESIGASLIAAGITGWVIFLYLYLTSSAADRLALVEKLALREAFPYRSVAIRDKYELRLRAAREQIDILGFGLRSLREDLSKDFPAWASRAEVRILLLDPEFPTSAQSLAKARDREEGNPEGSIGNDVRAFVREVAHLMSENPRFKVRLYQAIPSINYFRIDDDVFWGPYFVATQSRNTPTFLVGRSGMLFAPLAAHFDQLWGDRFSRDVPKDWMQ